MTKMCLDQNICGILTLENGFSMWLKQLKTAANEYFNLAVNPNYSDKNLFSPQ